MKTILADIQAFLDRHLMEPSAFGRESINDPHLVEHLQRSPSRQLRRRTLARIRQYMAAKDAKGPPKRLRAQRRSASA